MWPNECEGKTWQFLFHHIYRYFSRYDHVHLISHKSEALDCLTQYINMVENQLDKSIKALRTYRGREYLS
jgi:hypothetical protein